MATIPHGNWLRFALAGSVLMPVLHVAVLLSSQQDPLTTPVSALSRTDWGFVHTLGLVIFGSAHIALAIALGGLDRGRLWPYGRLLLVAAGVTLFYVAYYFANASESQLYGTNANDPLWVVASLVGFAMGAMQPGLSRLSRGLGMFSTVCLGIWLWLVPVILLVNDSWLGGYERIVGGVYVIWLAGVTFGIISVAQSRGEQRDAVT